MAPPQNNQKRHLNVLCLQDLSQTAKQLHEISLSLFLFVLSKPYYSKTSQLHVYPRLLLHLSILKELDSYFTLGIYLQGLVVTWYFQEYF